VQQEQDKLQAKTEAEKNISEIERNIQDQNLRLNQEVRLQNDVISYLEKKKGEVADENWGYEKDLEQNTQTVEEYARKQFEQNKKIKMLKQKIEMLEKSLAKIVEDFEKEKELLKFQSESIVREQDEDLISKSSFSNSRHQRTRETQKPWTQEHQSFVSNDPWLTIRRWAILPWSLRIGKVGGQDKESY
jgi:hypothetical protein